MDNLEKIPSLCWLIIKAMVMVMLVVFFAYAICINHPIMGAIIIGVTGYVTYNQLKKKKHDD